MLLRLFGVATVVALTATSLTVPAHAAGTGLDGTITNALTGAPVVGAGIVIQHPDGSGWNFANSDSAGNYDFPDASGQYVVRVSAGGYVEQSLNATAPGTTDISLMPIQYGSIAGRAFKHGGGVIPNVYVELRRNDNQVANTATDAKGRYRFDNVETGTYTIKFRFPSGFELWYDNADESHRSTFEVTPGATTTINVTRPPVGNLVIKALDKVTGKPIAGYCWYYQEGPQHLETVCTNSKGQAKLTDILTGTYRGGGFDQNEVYVNALYGPATVTSGNTTTTTVRIEKSVSVRVSFVDAATGGPITGAACVRLASPVPTGVGTGSQCGSQVEFKNLFSQDIFQVWVAPVNGVHGAQWVSETGGGTGDPELAKVFRPNPGERVEIVARLDGAGSVTGVVRDVATGAEVGSVCPSPTRPRNSYGPNENADCTFGGTYFVRNLGPYQWKLAFPAFDGRHAWAWSGNAPNRATATPVQVVAGQSVTLDVALPATGTISGAVTGPEGSCLQCTGIVTLDAVTGEYAGISPFIAADGTFTIKGFHTQDVWLYYSFGEELIRYPTMLQTTAGGAVTGVVINRPS